MTSLRLLALWPCLIFMSIMAASPNARAGSMEDGPPDDLSEGPSYYGYVRDERGSSVMRAKVTLTPNDQGCELSYSVTAQVGGKIAQLGQRLIDGVAKSLSEEFFKRFDAETERLYPVQDSTAPADAPASQPQAQGWPSWVWVVGAVVVAALIYTMR